ncbi:MAG: hypothetical protein ACPL2N_08200 [Candidatus Cryosericum sp.]
MKRFLTSLTVLAVVFVIFALIVSPLRMQRVQLTILFFPTITASVEAVAYVSFLVGLLLATWIAFVEELALRRRYREAQADLQKRLKAAEENKRAPDNFAPASPGEQQPGQ